LCVSLSTRHKVKEGRGHNERKRKEKKRDVESVERRAGEQCRRKGGQGKIAVKVKEAVSNPLNPRKVKFKKSSALDEIAPQDFSPVIIQRNLAVQNLETTANPKHIIINVFDTTTPRKEGGFSKMKMQ